ncbi:hypothetical protein M422DRAFT_47847 [Sphaerobolus stellatus SS14]|uniref:Uncharacterized protein n=1 Tax=Sphaerobolus stellatus (strain SS14) TaxID=990650 RepID=A0A0C9VYQ8_SPHS4|nr:hypothetical protein M422DRAFT_47847 [Sphaerobolus stellatus SS14]
MSTKNNNLGGDAQHTTRQGTVRPLKPEWNKRTKDSGKSKVSISKETVKTAVKLILEIGSGGRISSPKISANSPIGPMPSQETIQLGAEQGGAEGRISISTPSSEVRSRAQSKTAMYQYGSIEQSSDEVGALGLITRDDNFGKKLYSAVSAPADIPLNNSDVSASLSQGMEGGENDIFPRSEEYPSLDTSITNWAQIVQMIYPEEFSTPKKTFKNGWSLSGDLLSLKQNSSEESETEININSPITQRKIQPMYFPKEKEFYTLLKDWRAHQRIGFKYGNKLIQLNAVAVEIVEDNLQEHGHEFIAGSSKGKNRMEGERPNPEIFNVKIESQSTIKSLKERDINAAKRFKSRKKSRKQSTRQPHQSSKNNYQCRFSRAPSEMPTSVYFPIVCFSASESSSSTSDSSKDTRREHPVWETPLDPRAGSTNAGGDDSGDSSSSSSSSSSSDSDSSSSKGK